MICPICQSPSQGTFKTRYALVKRCKNRSCNHLFSEIHFVDQGVMEYSEEADFSKFYKRNNSFVDYLISRSYLPAKAKVLDLGSGTGHIAKTFLDRGFDLTCIELSESARKILGSMGLKNYPDLSKIPNGQLYDAILMVEVIEHITLPVEFLSEARNFLAPGGFMFLSTPCSSGLKAIFNREQSQAFSVPEHIHFFNSESLERCLHSSGFSQFHREHLNFMVPGESSLKKALNRALYTLNLHSHLTYFPLNS